MPRYALITGASSGIGLALAEALARRGRALILVARQRDALESIAYELAQRFGVEVLFRTCDLSEPLQLSGLLHELEQGERQIDLLVNNAGIGTSGPFIDQEWAREQELIELNILALARLCHSLGARMAAQGGGQILNIASVAAFNAGADSASYAASKAAVVALTRSAAQSYAPQGIRVNALCPGWVDTPMAAAEMAEMAAELGITEAEARERTVARIGLGRMASADEMAGACLFLCGPDASFVTGIALVVDGGSRVAAGVRAV